MPRASKSKEFEIDFKFPHRERDILLKDDGTDKYDNATLLSFIANATDVTEYARDFQENVSRQIANGKEITSNQEWTLHSIAIPHTPAFKELDDKFFVWYDSRPDMAQMYESVSQNIWWMYDRNGNHHSQEACRNKGWDKRPESWKMFYNAAFSGEGARYRELHREVVYDIGDQVVLREPFKNSWRYDPCYSLGLPNETDRVGMVIEHVEQISRRSRGGKGTRLINILWLNTGEKKLIAENKIKKYRAPKE